jgi:hypothetical protein
VGERGLEGELDLMRVHKHTSIHTRALTHSPTRARTNAGTQAHTHAHAHAHTRTRARAHARTHRHARTHAHTHARKHKYTRACVRARTHTGGPSERAAAPAAAAAPLPSAASFLMLEADENQYSAGGVSACTVMSTEAALQVLQLSAEGTVDEAGLLLALNAALRPAALYSRNQHLSCSDVLAMNPYAARLVEQAGLAERVSSNMQGAYRGAGQAPLEQMGALAEGLLREAGAAQCGLAAVLTRTPETVALIAVPHDATDANPGGGGGGGGGAAEGAGGGHWWSLILILGVIGPRRHWRNSVAPWQRPLTLTRYFPPMTKQYLRAWKLRISIMQRTWTTLS